MLELLGKQTEDWKDYRTLEKLFMFPDIILQITLYNCTVIVATVDAINYNITVSTLEKKCILEQLASNSNTEPPIKTIVYNFRDRHTYKS